MTFDNSNDVDAICWDLVYSDFPRRQRRARIDDLANGLPPYSQQEVADNNIDTNVNFLGLTRTSHDARLQFFNNYFRSRFYFNARTDWGPVHKRSEYSTIVTNAAGKMMRNSLNYFETNRSQFALNVLHGIAPDVWPDEDFWAPEPKGIDEILIPAQTYLHMRNLPLFAVYHSFTAPELIKLTRGPNVDPGWNKPLVKRCLKQIDQDTMRLRSDNWPEVWSPEKISERIKGDGGYYYGDRVPTIDCYDFYFWSDDKKSTGWKRRIILDSWSMGPSGTGYTLDRKEGFWGKANDFLYSSGTRTVADKREQLLAFQFADLSAVAPFQYHSVRSLGYLLFAVCHLQNRLRCQFTSAVFENLMMLYRVKTEDEVQRLLKTNYINKGFVDQNFEWIPAAERHQINEALVQLGLQENEQIIHENVSSMNPPSDWSRDRVEKTKFQVMAELNASTQLVSAVIGQSFMYKRFEYMEIFRRLLKPNSRDPEVRNFRATVLKQGVPEKLLVPEAWEIDSESAMGGGNRMEELAIADWLMKFRQLYDPEAQRKILRQSTLIVTSKPDVANDLVPEQPHISDSIHDAQLAAGSLMQGLPVAIKSGINRVEYIEALIADMAIIVQRIDATPDKTGTAEQLLGLSTMSQHIEQNIALLAQDEEAKPIVRGLQQQLAKLLNYVRAFAQRLLEKQQSANGNQLDPETIAKIQGILLMAKAKADNARTSHAQRTAQRQVSFEQKFRQQQQQDQLDLQKQAADAALDIQTNRLKAFSE